MNFIDRLPRSLITVTRFSKILAGSLFIVLPVGGFYLGTIYQKNITPVVKVYYQTKPVPNASPTPELTIAENVPLDLKEALKIRDQVKTAIKMKDVNFFLNLKFHETMKCNEWSGTPFESMLLRMCQGGAQEVIVYSTMFWRSEGGLSSLSEEKAAIKKYLDTEMQYSHLYQDKEGFYVLTFTNGIGSLILGRDRVTEIRGYDPVINSDDPDLNFKLID